MKKYQQPEFEIVVLSVNDVLVASDFTSDYFEDDWDNKGDIV